MMEELLFDVLQSIYASIWECEAIAMSCKKHNDRDGEMFWSGKAEAYNRSYIWLCEILPPDRP